MKTIQIYLIGFIILIAAISCQHDKQDSFNKNLAVVAISSSFPSGPWLDGLNDGNASIDSLRWHPKTPRNGSPLQWVQYEWEQPITTSEMAIYLWNYHNTLPLPNTYWIKYWDGHDFVTIKKIAISDMIENQMNVVNFDEIKTTKLRIEVDTALLFPANILEWEVYQASGSPDYPPVVLAGVDRDVIIDGKTYLTGRVKSVTPVDKIEWSKEFGPGKVVFEDSESVETTARFSKEGDYILKLTVKEGKLKSSSELKVKVHLSPPHKPIESVYTTPYKINNLLWNDRIKAIIVNWIPHCIDQINRIDLEIGQGGIDNFVEAAKALQGKPHEKHRGYVFSNAWVHQTVESICLALMVDPQGDKEIIDAQGKMKVTLEDWIPKILAAQEPDGYLHTAYTLRDTMRWKERWSPMNRDTHEGYVMGYFIESAINHYILTKGQDKRLYNAAKKVANCWLANIGSSKKVWYDGHQEMEQALIRLGRFVNDIEGNGRGDDYIKLAKFLLDNRGGGNEYDQSHLPVQKQYEAVGHAVRAIYCYSGMADVAIETRDVDYQSAVMSLWNNIVNKKYYVTGGIGSGETSEGFGPNYSLPNRAYCESCSSCGLIFFQHKMNLIYHDAKYADLFEETLYNALLGSLDLGGENYYYTNSLIQDNVRYPWHVCPCCVGNIPRTLLMIPTWTYAKSDDGLFVNLFVGSTVNIENVANVDLGIIQETDYPWSNNVSITINPSKPKEFTLYLRIPDRTTSRLYKSNPEVNGYISITLNNKPIKPVIEKGYAVIKHRWEKGDKINLQFPMKIQVITADEKIESDRDKVALRYGPLVYVVETADQTNIDKIIDTDHFFPQWRKDLLNGIITINGK